MKDEMKLLDAIGEVSDDKIIHAKRNTGKKHRVRWLAAAACVTLLLCSTILLFQRNSDVVYASSISNHCLIDSDDQKVVVDDAIIAVEGNKKIRMAIVIRNYEDGYPQLKANLAEEGELNYSEWITYYEQLDDEYREGKLTWDDYLEKSNLVYQAMDELREDALEMEAKWLTNLGAEDLSIGSYATIVCTLKKDTISQLENGKCSYVVVMATANSEDVSNRDIASYYGEYDHGECIYIPLYSSYLPLWSDCKLVLSEDTLKLSSEEGEQYELSDPIYEKLEGDEAVKQYDQMETDMIEEFGSAEMLKLLNEEMMIYRISNTSGKSCLLYVTEDSLYFDLGLWGILRF